MARQKSIRYQMREALGKMATYGTSKHEQRQLSKAEGVDLTKGQIYSYGTMRTYQNEVKRYGDWLESRGMHKCSMDEAASHIQEYLNHQADRGLSAWSVHTTAAALSKTFQTDTRQYSIPRRQLCDITRSRGVRSHDEANNRRAGDVLEANRTLALRRNELKNLRVSNFTDGGSSITMSTIGKGGKHNETVFRHPEELATIRELIANKEPADYVFDRQAFKNDADYHQTRAEGFQLRYQRICEDMRQRPEARAEYQQAIRDAFAAKGRELREDLNRPYVCRGSHREALERQGIAVTYDRTAVMMVSLESHYRSDVLVQHYLAK